MSVSLCCSFSFFATSFFGFVFIFTLMCLYMSGEAQVDETEQDKARGSKLPWSHPSEPVSLHHPGQLYVPPPPSLPQPGQCKMGIMPGHIHRPGNIGKGNFIQEGGTHSIVGYGKETLQATPLCIELFLHVHFHWEKCLSQCVV